MKNGFFNYFKSSVLLTLVASLAIILYLAKTHWGISITITGIITTLLILISKYWWRYYPFKWLYWVDDFSGRYEGILQYQYFDDNGTLQTGERKHIKIINQRGYRISVASFTLKQDGTRSSPSFSKGLFIEEIEDGQHYQLIYHYLNEGNKQLAFAPHFGTDVLKFIKRGESKELSGGYYTDREPQTKGVYKNLKWVSNDLNHEF